MHTFERNERLKSRKLLSRLFQEGRAFVAYPLRVVWLPLSEAERAVMRFGGHPAQVAISVPKRRYKSAVMRNRVRRQVREAYRLSKHVLYEQLKCRSLHIALIFIFVGKEDPSFEQLAGSMRKVVQFFARQPLPLSE